MHQKPIFILQHAAKKCSALFLMLSRKSNNDDVESSSEIESHSIHMNKCESKCVGEKPIRKAVSSDKVLDVAKLKMSVESVVLMEKWMIRNGEVRNVWGSTLAWRWTASNSMVCQHRELFCGQSNFMNKSV